MKYSSSEDPCSQDSPLPINALQILFVNFFSDSFPAISYAFETESDVRANKARRTCNNRCGVKNPYPLHRFYWKCRTLTLYLALTKFGFPDAIVRTFIFSSFSLYSLIVAFFLPQSASSNRDLLDFFKPPAYNQRLLRNRSDVGCGLCSIPTTYPKNFRSAAYLASWRFSYSLSLISFS